MARDIEILPSPWHEVELLAERLRLASLSREGRRYGVDRLASAAAVLSGLASALHPDAEGRLTPLQRTALRRLVKAAAAPVLVIDVRGDSRALWKLESELYEFAERHLLDGKRERDVVHEVDAALGSRTNAYEGVDEDRDVLDEIIASLPKKRSSSDAKSVSKAIVRAVFRGYDVKLSNAEYQKKIDGRPESSKKKPSPTKIAKT